MVPSQNYLNDMTDVMPKTVNALKEGIIKNVIRKFLHDNTVSVA